MAKLMGSVMVVTEEQPGNYTEHWSAHCDFASYPPMPDKGEVIVVQEKLDGDLKRYRVERRSFRYGRHLMGETEGPLLTVLIVCIEVEGRL